MASAGEEARALERIIGAANETEGSWSEDDRQQFRDDTEIVRAALSPTPASGSEQIEACAREIVGEPIVDVGPRETDPGWQHDMDRVRAILARHGAFAAPSPAPVEDPLVWTPGGHITRTSTLFAPSPASEQPEGVLLETLPDGARCIHCDSTNIRQMGGVGVCCNECGGTALRVVLPPASSGAGTMETEIDAAMEEIEHLIVEAMNTETAVADLTDDADRTTRRAYQERADTAFKAALATIRARLSSVHPGEPEERS